MRPGFRYESRSAAQHRTSQAALKRRPRLQAWQGGRSRDPRAQHHACTASQRLQARVRPASGSKCPSPRSHGAVVGALGRGGNERRRKRCRGRRLRRCQQPRQDRARNAGDNSGGDGTGEYSGGKCAPVVFFFSPAAVWNGILPRTWRVGCHRSASNLSEDRRRQRRQQEGTRTARRRRQH